MVTRNSCIKNSEELNPEQHAELKHKIMSKYINMSSEQDHEGFLSVVNAKQRRLHIHKLKHAQLMNL